MKKLLVCIATLATVAIPLTFSAPARACDQCAAGGGGGGGGARLNNMFEEADADESGGLSLEEFVDSRNTMRDAVSDGTSCQHGEADECDCAGRGGAERPADTDGDGTVSDEERTAHMTERFTQIDADGDGTLTIDELRAARRARRGLGDGGGSGGGGGNGGGGGGQ